LICLSDYRYILVKIDGMRNLFGIRIADSYGNKELIAFRNAQFFSILCLLFTVECSFNAAQNDTAQAQSFGCQMNVFNGDAGIVESYISYLRRKIDEGEELKLIQTVRGRGYVIREET